MWLDYASYHLEGTEEKIIITLFQIALVKSLCINSMYTPQNLVSINILIFKTILFFSFSSARVYWYFSNQAGVASPFLKEYLWKPVANNNTHITEGSNFLIITDPKYEWNPHIWNRLLFVRLWPKLVSYMFTLYNVLYSLLKYLMPSFRSYICIYIWTITFTIWYLLSHPDWIILYWKSCGI